MNRTGCFLAFLSIPLLHAAGGSLGVAVSDGGFLLNQSAVRGNATLLEGATVETLETPSRIELTNGAQLKLGAGSRVRVFPNRVALEKGGGEVSLPDGFTIEAQTLRIAPQKEKVRANIQLRGAKTVEVASAAGVLRVVNANGVLVSRVEAGMALAFEPQAGQAAPSSFIGCLLKMGDGFVVYDETTRMVVDLRGSNLDREWGNRVQVNGTARAASQQAGGNQVLDVTSVTRIDAGGCASVAQAIGAQLPSKAPAGSGSSPAGTASKGGGMSAGTKVAIVVAVAGGGGGAAAVLATKSRSK